MFGGDKTPPLCLEEVRSGGIEVGGIALLVQAEPLVSALPFMLWVAPE